MKDYVIAYNNAQTKKWKQMVSFMNAHINEDLLYLPDEVIFEYYDNFSKKFTTAHIDLFLEDFYEWRDYENCRPEKLPDLLDFYSKVIYALNKRNKQPDNSILNNLYEAYEIFPTI